jgi:drug/metabolite transporter (DMT)-like permease
LVSFVAGQRLQVYGNEIGSATNSAVLMSFEPLITTCAASLVLKEHLGPRRIVGFTLGIAGVALLNGMWRPDFKMASMAASFIFISSFICEAIFSVVAKPVIMRASIMKMLAISLAIGTAVNLAIDGESTLRAARMLSTSDWVVLALLGVVCTAIGYSVWFVVIRECPVSVAALTIFAQTVFGVIVAAVWLGEKLKWEHLAGSFTIVTGLAIGLSRQVRVPEPFEKPKNL